jgi:hypothetical protein
VLSQAAFILLNKEESIHNIVYNPIHTTTIETWLEEQRVKWPNNNIDDINHAPSSVFRDDTIMLVGDPAIIGRIVVHVEPTVLQADDPRRLMYGRVIWESIGIAVIDDTAVAKLVIV